MDWLRFVGFSLPLILCFIATYSKELGSPCSQNEDCAVANSFCNSSICACRHYYAQYNSTTCLESILLGRDCLIKEQCSLRVANSTCRNGICQCSEGFTRFRKHTCLEPAKPGSICYSDQHCKMWSESSSCQFIIANLFGKCMCSKEANCENKETKNPLSMSLKNPANESQTQNVITDTYGNNKNKTEFQEGNNKKGNENTRIVNNNKEPVSSQKEHLQESASNLEVSGIANAVGFNEAHVARQDNETSSEAAHASFTNTNADYQINELGVSSLESKYRLEANGNPEHDWEKVKGISLGFPCRFDEQCQKEDTASRCIGGICDCVVKNNGTHSCGKKNTGCARETFQCRSSGRCISWFFVCDGRRDCPDGSDEECAGPKCPRLSFQCGANGNCISLAFVCDGTKNCRKGEDEQKCLPEHRSKHGACPDYTFQCTNGRCLPKYEFCNAIPKCDDGSDESPELCGSLVFSKKFNRSDLNGQCPFECTNGRCRSTAIVCSGRDGCGDNSDEARCTVCRCPKVIN